MAVDPRNAAVAMLRRLKSSSPVPHFRKGNTHGFLDQDPPLLARRWQCFVRCIKWISLGWRCTGYSSGSSRSGQYNHAKGNGFLACAHGTGQQFQQTVKSTGGEFSSL